MKASGIRIRTKSGYIFMILLVFTILILFTVMGCNEVNGVEENGTIHFKLRTWNSYLGSTERNLPKNAHNLDLVDIRSYKYAMKLTTDDIYEGMAESDINWVTIYTSDELLLDSERDFTFELPPGTYKGFGLFQGSQFYWVGNYNGSNIEFPTSNRTAKSQVYDIFGLDGLYVPNSGGFLEKVPNDEQIGTNITVAEGSENTLTIRLNLDKILWYDNDNSGNWSNGDTFNDPTLPDGIETMSDFIFE